LKIGIKLLCNQTYDLKTSFQRIYNGKNGKHGLPVVQRVVRAPELEGEHAFHPKMEEKIVLHTIISPILLLENVHCETVLVK